MITNNAMDKALSEWSKAWKKENLDEETTRLIAQANWDLYYGPCDEEGFPGFTTAVKKISDALEDIVPGELFYEEWSGCINGDMPEFDEDGGDDVFYVIHRKDILGSIVGKELVQYL